jgi:hypothetical protein
MFEVGNLEYFPYERLRNTLHPVGYYIFHKSPLFHV